LKKKTETSSLEEELKLICQVPASELMIQKNKNELVMGGEIVRNRFNLVLGFTRHLSPLKSCADRVVNWAEILAITFVNDT